MQRLASIRLTLLGLIWLGIGCAFLIAVEMSAGLAVVPPLVLLAVNLLAGVIYNSAMRKTRGLLIFHLALLVLMMLVVLGRLTYLDGATEITEGEQFRGLTLRDAGWFHRDRLDRIRFVNDAVLVRYRPDGQREMTESRLTIFNADGSPRSVSVTELNPYLSDGYRFLPTFNKGFAPIFRWAPLLGEPVVGSVHLPSYPLNAATQWRDWNLPAEGGSIWTGLNIEEELLPPGQSSLLRLPKRYHIVVRTADQRFELRPGDRVRLPNGELQFLQLRMWMGYSVFYDWTIPWLLVACLVGIGGMSAHFVEKFKAEGWKGAA